MIMHSVIYTNLGLYIQKITQTIYMYSDLGYSMVRCTYTEDNFSRFLGIQLF